MIKKSLALAIIFGISSYAYAEKSVIGLNADMTSVGKTRSELKINSSNVFDDDKNRYAFKNMSEFFPSKTISKGTEKEYIFNKVLINDIIDNLPFEYTNKVENKKTKTTIKDMLYNTRTDAFIVLKDGDIVYEQYFDGQDETTRHQMMSVSKSLTGMLAASLVSEGKLDPQAKVSTYIPDLKNSGYGNATVQQVLDMLVEIKYSEDYADPEAEVNNYKAALGFGEFSANYEGEKNIKGFLETLQGVSIGDKFQYATPSTDVMCWLVESATNTPIEKLMYDRIWSKMGMQRDSYVLNDNEGTLSCGGGFNVTALDSAKIGVMLSNKGQFNNAQILTKESVENIMAGGDKKAFGEYSKGEFSSYKDQFWIRGNKNKAFSAIGIHGQWIYVDPTEKVVIIKQSSFPIADSSEIESYTIAGFNAIINKLSK